MCRREHAGGSEDGRKGAGLRRPRARGRTRGRGKGEGRGGGEMISILDSDDLEEYNLGDLEEISKEKAKKVKV